MDLPTAPVTERGDAERLRHVLARELMAGRWQDSEKLPTERALGLRFGVARNTVRRALAMLEQQGLIIRHVGRGTFKAPVPHPSDPFEVPQAALSPADVVECRLVFEPELAGLVVARATGVDLDRMDACIAGAEEATDLEGFEHWDGQLHDAIAVATHNATVIAMARSLACVRLNAEWGKLKARAMTPEHKSALQRQHRAIVAAFRHRDRDEARSLLRTHIVYVRSYMFGD
ncbi:MAG TPA: FCD domain-containing protein [Acetobacteraceae bacterium]|nr:FCD domain-containing protein [Acetobacteraceae bacterium]